MTTSTSNVGAASTSSPGGGGCSSSSGSDADAAGMPSCDVTASASGGGGGGDINSGNNAGCCAGSKTCQEPRDTSAASTVHPIKSSCCDDDKKCSSATIKPSCCSAPISNPSKAAKSCCDNDAGVDNGNCCSPKIAPAAKSCCGDNGGGGSKTTKQTDCCGNEIIEDGCCSSKKIPAAKSCCDGGGSGSKTAKTSNMKNNVSVAVKSCCNDSGNSAKQVAASCCSSSTTKPATKSCCDLNAESNTSCCPPKNTDCCNKSIDKTQSCLAVIRPDNSAVDVFDTKGRSKTFRFNSKRKDMSGKKLCFSTHGAGEDIDGMLTPCFNRNGEHDEPEEECACGEEEPHLHAHIYDPEICGVVDDSAGCASAGAASARKKATNWRFLSQVTLLLDDDGSKEEASYMPITESMPKECNSGALQNHLTERGLKLSHWLRWRNDGEKNQACNENSYCGVSCKSHRLYPIRHEDHTDFLIHNETTGALHLEHPNCASCGENDIHGRFRLVHTRSWMGDPNKGKNKGSRIKLHFFQVHEEPFRLMDVLSGMFELESSRVHAVRAVVEETSSSLSRVGRSQFHVKGICCASEIPQVESILRPIDGVVEISINTTTKTVYVDHNVDVVSAIAIANELNDQNFGAVVKKDAAVAMDQMVGIPTEAFVDSRFDLTDVLNDTNEADRGKIADVIRACLDQKVSEEQVKNIIVNEQEKILSVEHNPYYLTAPGIAIMLANFCYDVKIVSDGGADGMWALSLMQEDTEDTIEHHKSTVRWTVVLSGVFWIISMLSFIGGNWDYLKYVALLSVAFGLPPIAVKAFKTLRRFRFDVNCMMFFAAAGALALQEYTESAAVTFLFAISDYLEARATARARNALSAIVCLRPERANVINPLTKAIVVLPASAVAVGVLVSVRTGDKIPCDGVVVEGKSTIDESSLTGESRPVNKSPGMPVSGGTINTGNTQLVIKTTATSNNSAVARLIRLIEEAQSNRSETEKMVDTFAKIYTPIVVLAALCMCTIPWAFGNETGTFWAKNGLITIVIACPCALIISTPVTYVAGLAAVAQRGVIIKGGQHLEALGRVKSIAFDKTGTLSQGIFALLHFEVIVKGAANQSRSREEVLGYLALMEAPASHPLSDAIVKGAANEQVEIPKLELKNHTLLPGEGITASVAGKTVYVGNTKLFKRLSMYDALPEDVKIMTEEWAQSAGTIGFISIEGEGIIGTYCVADKVRDEAKDVVATLKKMGIEITMLTGDQRPAAIGIGGQVGLDENDIRSELLPEDKMVEIGDRVKENKTNKTCWKAKRAAMMVGDGVNDAPALALADISVAMGEGAALAMETADVTLMDSDLRKLLYIIRMGRRVIRTIIENVVFSLAVKAIVMGFTFAGRASLWAAIGTDVGAMLIVTLNGMKLLPSSRKVKENDLAH
mmetsp:Transcript_29767/g.63127  ORF Transcript_29767/g.63127 Transcript_29767/m.63127 type:complete len:1409 (+) Transcript_29767:67-4293(+)